MLAGATGRRSWKCEREAACPTVLLTPDSSRLHRRRFRFKLWMCFRHLGKEACAENCGCRQLRLRLQDGSSNGSSRHLEVTKGSDEGSWSRVAPLAPFFAFNFGFWLQVAGQSPRLTVQSARFAKGTWGDFKFSFPLNALPAHPGSL